MPAWVGFSGRADALSRLRHIPRWREVPVAHGIGIAVRKDDPLTAKLNAALKAIVDDGTYKKINDKYFPFSIY